MVSVQVQMSQKDAKTWMTIVPVSLTKTTRKTTAYIWQWCMKGWWHIYGICLIVFAVLLAGANIAFGGYFYTDNEENHFIPNYLLITGSSYVVIAVLTSMGTFKQATCLKVLCVYFSFVHSVIQFLETITVYSVWFNEESSTGDITFIRNDLLVTSAFILVNCGLFYIFVTCLWLCMGNKWSKKSDSPSKRHVVKKSGAPFQVLQKEACSTPLISNV